MTKADLIRNYLRDRGATSPGGAITREQIRVALSLAKSPMSSGINDLKKAGFIASVGKVRSLRYYVTGKQPRPRFTEEEWIERERERQIRRRRAAGGVSRAEYLAACAAKSAASADAKRLKPKPERKPRVAKVKPPVIKVPRVVAKKPMRVLERKPTVAAPPVVAQSVEDWLAKGGQVQVLQPSEVSKPFRAIGRAA